MFKYLLHRSLKNKFFCWYFFGLLIISKATFVFAFDDASEINHTYLNQENFLDIKSYHFNKLKEEKWHESGEGWRVNGGSLGLDLLYTNLEARLQNSISEEISVIFTTKQEEFYEIKPFNYLVEVEWRVYDWIAFSLLGMPEYDKRNADQGASITLGKKPWNFLRFSQLLQDLHYNEKNFYDSSYYSSHPIESVLEGAFLWKNWRTRLNLFNDKEFRKIYPNEGLIFSHKGKDYSALLDYHYGKNQLIGFSSRYFDILKIRQKPLSNEIGSPDNREQQLLYDSIDFYWLHQLNSNFHWTIGFREDRFRNFFRQLDLAKDSYDFNLWTFQCYGILRHQTEMERFWEYAIYVGDTDKGINYITEDNEDKKRRKTESKLRVSWEFQNLKNGSSLMLTTSWNMDNFFNDFWDGGNIQYQKTF